MYDVLHYMFEDDTIPNTAELGDAKDRFRIMVYREFYGRGYKYASSAANRLPDDDGPLNDYDDLPTPFDPKNNLADAPPRTAPPKPYIPPTNFNTELVNPYNGVLDPPMGF